MGKDEKEFKEDLEVGSQGAEGDVEKDNKDEKEEQSVPLSELHRRLKAEKRKYEQALALKDAETVKEVKKAKMSQAEKLAFDLEERESAIEEREKELTERLLKAEVKGKLSSNGLPDTFTDLLLVLGDTELIDMKIAEIKATMEEKVNVAVKGKLGQPEPRVETRTRVAPKGSMGKKDIFSNKK